MPLTVELTDEERRWLPRLLRYGAAAVSVIEERSGVAAQLRSAAISLQTKLGVDPSAPLPTHAAAVPKPREGARKRTIRED